MPDLLEIPVSHVICESLDDYGHGQSWTCAVYILHADFLGAMGGDEDPIPPDGVMHPLPIASFRGILRGGGFPSRGSPVDEGRRAASVLQLGGSAARVRHVVGEPDRYLA